MSHKTGFEKDRPSLLLNGGRQFQFGRWFRRGSTITVLPKSNALAAEQQASYELSGGGIPRLSGLKLTPGAALRVRGSRLDAASTRTTSRVLTYTSKDVIDDRISIPAQHSLVRLSKNSATNADAVGMLEEVKAGRLAGIFCVNWQRAAQRALRLGKSWWTAIPKGEDAVLLLDPDDLMGGAPIIAFRRDLDPACGLLQGEKRFDPDPLRLDRALRQVWSTYQLLRTGTLSRCPAQPGVILAEAPSLESSLANVVPPILCQVTGGAGKTIVVFASGYLSPYILRPSARGQGTDKKTNLARIGEINALNRGLWEPSNEDFAAIAQRSSAPTKLPVSSLQFLLGIISSQTAGSIQKLMLIGHSSPTTFSFAGQIGTQFVHGRETSLVTFDPAFAAINRDNLKAAPADSFIKRNRLWDRFVPGGEVILFGCHSGLSRSTAPVAAVAFELLDALSNAFRVCVSGFKNEICTILGHRGPRITERGLLAYDPRGRLGCRDMLNRRFFRTLEQLTPDVRSCVGVAASRAVVS